MKEIIQDIRELADAVRAQCGLQSSLTETNHLNDLGKSIFVQVRMGDDLWTHFRGNSNYPEEMEAMRDELGAFVVAHRWQHVTTSPGAQVGCDSEVMAERREVA